MLLFIPSLEVIYTMFCSYMSLVNAQWSEFAECKMISHLGANNTTQNIMPGALLYLYDCEN